MSRTAAQRYAVFTVHKERCWICDAPVTYSEMEVEHIVPESLDGSPDLPRILEIHGLPPIFNVNSYENWLPAHRRCNGKKGDIILKPSILTQVWLQKAAEAAPRARELEAAFINNRQIERAIATVLSAHEAHRLTAAQMEALGTIRTFIEAHREPEERGAPFNLAPWLTIVGGGRDGLILRGPSGMVGHRPAGRNLHPSWDCPTCGPTGWNGTRCISCGHMIDPD